MEWKRFKDEKPPQRHHVLVSSLYGAKRPFIAYYVKDTDYGDCWLDFEDYLIAENDDYWMELPEPPKDE
jgi:hypothetical protein